MYESGSAGAKRAGKGKRPAANNDTRKETYANGNVYIGGFVNGNSHGKGTYIFANGDVYEGDFVDNLFHGKGKRLLQTAPCTKVILLTANRPARGEWEGDKNNEGRAVAAQVEQIFRMNAGQIELYSCITGCYNYSFFGILFQWITNRQGLT